MLWIGVVLALAIYQGVQFIGFLLMAFQAERYGVICEEIGLGFGPTIARFRLFSIPVLLKLFPYGGFAKFPGDEHEQLDLLESKPFSVLPPSAHILSALLGPLCLLVVGFLLIQIATLLPDSNLIVTSKDLPVANNFAQEVAYPAVPGLSTTGASLTWGSAWSLFHDAILEFWIRFFTLDSLKNWAGAIGWLVMTGDLLGTHPGAFFTAVGMIFWSGLLFNMAPVPILFGGRIIMILIDCFGFQTCKSSNLLLTGMAFVLVVGANLLWLDFKWFHHVSGAVF